MQVHEVSIRVCKPMINQIISGEYLYDYQCKYDQVRERRAMSDLRRKQDQTNLSTLMESLSNEDQRRLCLAGERGASNWWTALPIRDFGFALCKRDFVDALCLRYGWQPSDLPMHCACGVKFSVEHALSCLKRGFVIGRHNEVRDFTASVLSEVCKDVMIEPAVQPVPEKDSMESMMNVSEGAIDIAVSGVWGGKV